MLIERKYWNHFQFMWNLSASFFPFHLRCDCARKLSTLNNKYECLFRKIIPIHFVKKKRKRKEECGKISYLMKYWRDNSSTQRDATTSCECKWQITVILTIWYTLFTFSLSLAVSLCLSLSVSLAVYVGMSRQNAMNIFDLGKYLSYIPCTELNWMNDMVCWRNWIKNVKEKANILLQYGKIRWVETKSTNFSIQFSFLVMDFLSVPLHYWDFIFGIYVGGAYWIYSHFFCAVQNNEDSCRLLAHAQM